MIHPQRARKLANRESVPVNISFPVYRQLHAIIFELLDSVENFSSKLKLTCDEVLVSQLQQQILVTVPETETPHLYLTISDEELLCRPRPITATWEELGMSLYLFRCFVFNSPITLLILLCTWICMLLTTSFCSLTHSLIFASSLDQTSGVPLLGCSK